MVPRFLDGLDEGGDAGGGALERFRAAVALRYGLCLLRQLAAGCEQLPDPAQPFHAGDPKLAVVARVVAVRTLLLVRLLLAGVHRR